MNATDDSAEARNQTKKRTIATLDAEFALLHQNSCGLIQEVSPQNLYKIPFAGLAEKGTSLGESVLRSAAVVEQTFGGITANLWDDPFEWTLPETLTTPESIVKYLGEVETTRR